MANSAYERPSVDRQKGSAALSTVVVFGFLLVFVVLFVQYSVFLYGRGAVRSGLQEAARAAAPSDSPEEVCRNRFESVRSGLLGGELGAGVGEVSCVVDNDLMLVSVDVTFQSWFPAWPDWSFTSQAVAIREV